MRAIQQLLSTIRRILGLSNSVRSTSRSVKRETNMVSQSVKPKSNETKSN